MRELIAASRFHKQELIRDDSDESGRYYFHTTYYDDAALERNKRIRLDGLMERGQRVPTMDGGEIAYAFSVPPDQFGVFRRKYPDIYAGLISRSIEDNHKAAQELATIHPEWVTMMGNW